MQTPTSKPSSQASSLLNISTNSTTTPSPSTTSVSPHLDPLGRRLSLAPPASHTNTTDIPDAPGQSFLRAQRRLTLARELELTLEPMPILDRQTFLDTLALRDRATFEPAIAAYYAAHPERIPDRIEDARTRRRKRYDDDHGPRIRDAVTGRVVDLATRQRELFDDWSLTSTTSSVSVREREVVGPKGEGFRGENVRCLHCEAERTRERWKWVRAVMGGWCCGLVRRSEDGEHGVVMVRSEKGQFASGSHEKAAVEVKEMVEENDVAGEEG